MPLTRTSTCASTTILLYYYTNILLLFYSFYTSSTFPSPLTQVEYMRFHNSFYLATHIAYVQSAYNSIRAKEHEIPWLYRYDLIRIYSYTHPNPNTIGDPVALPASPKPPAHKAAPPTFSAHKAPFSEPCSTL